ncbi:hypothetical protein BT93_L4375 [Corymbia citriodora subsp. variegata]|uniref:Methyltransferase n=1 Tax=Corymbia citriodora subsp. variegata TaxID=360336 RepID=A0A8T0CFX8_CORYI|nr:hypothetical protein BT93_L4375 [Corymbia citriodora subsp. variegata]
MSRPEDLLPPDLFYNDTESAKYTTSSRIKSIQSDMTRRALELLDLDQPSLILDVGCGSGLSGSIIAEEGHVWVGMDISPSMLDIAVQRQQQQHNDDEDENEGDLFLADMGQGIPFKPGTFDAVVSISAVQWLCNAESSDVSVPSRLKRFFDGLYSCIKRGGKAVLQFYPKNMVQREMITQAAVKAGFGAGLLVDDEGTKNEKLYLVLSVGGSDIVGVVDGMEGVDVFDQRALRGALDRKRGKVRKGGKEWILERKEKLRGKGKVVKEDSRYTGRKRKVKF